MGSGKRWKAESTCESFRVPDTNLSQNPKHALSFRIWDQIDQSPRGNTAENASGPMLFIHKPAFDRKWIRQDLYQDHHCQDTAHLQIARTVLAVPSWSVSRFDLLYLPDGNGFLAEEATDCLIAGCTVTVTD